jgi:chemotaxis protein MotA
MFIIIGVVVVFGSIIAGFLMEHGNLRVLMQPAELIIIVGAANSAFYLETLKMCYEILNKARKDGLLAIESDIEEPDKSPVFTHWTVQGQPRILQKMK